MTLHLVIGASGLVGLNLMDALGKADLKAVGTYRSHELPGMVQLDIRQAEDVLNLVARLKPSVIYLPAAISNVDRCENEPEETYLTNVRGVENIVKAANISAAKVVYFSTDCVFDGKAGPYAEDDPVNPICEYARQKVMAEHHIALHGQDYLIIRTTVVYGVEKQGKNFICRLIRTLKAGDVLLTPSDQIGNPTYALNLAEAVVELAQSGVQGVYNVVGPQIVSRYEFAVCAAGVFGLDANLVKAVPTSELGQQARRPLNAGLLVDKVTRLLKVRLLPMEEGLRCLQAEHAVDV